MLKNGFFTVEIQLPQRKGDTAFGGMNEAALENLVGHSVLSAPIYTPHTTFISIQVLETTNQKGIVWLLTEINSVRRVIGPLGIYHTLPLAPSIPKVSHMFVCSFFS